MKKIFFCLLLNLTVTSLFAKSYEYNGEEPQNLIRPPVLRMTENGYRLIWNDNANKQQTVQFGKIKEKKEKLSPSAGNVNFKNSGYYLDFENLEAGNTYSVKIPGHKAIKFNAPKITEEDLSFSIISDHQTYPELTKKGFMNIAAFNPDFVISCGDMLEKGKTEYWAENFFANIQILQGVPFAAAEGNNDAGRNQFENYLALENRWYTCTYGMARFIFLDSNLPLRSDSEQYVWLENVLKKNTSRWTFVVYHHSSYISIKENAINKKTEEIQLLFEKYNVDAVFNGHHHIYDRTTPINGITYITFSSMSGSPSRYEVNENSGFYANQIQGFNGYASAKLTKDKLIIKIHNLDNEVLDEFEILK